MSTFDALLRSGSIVLPFCLAVVLLAGSAGASNRTIKIQQRPRINRAGNSEIWEWEIDPGAQYDNPFDPGQIALDAVFTGPEGHRLVIPAFWSADCRQHLDSQGDEQWDVISPGKWLVRACFPIAGQWQMEVIASDASGRRRSDPLKVDVASAGTNGFIRRAKDSDRYLQYESGKPYFAVGLNVGWPGRGGTSEFKNWFTHLGTAGGNFARVWMWRNNQFIENKETGPGRYDLAACAYYDEVLRLAGENGIACMLTFGNHSQLLDKTYWGAGGWPVDAYNATNGGPATRPSNYFDTGIARTLYQRRLRYLVARYGAYANLMAWELWNEQDVAEVKIPIDWTREMAGYLHQIDPYHHLVTTSFAGKGDAQTWALPEIDLTQSHFYGDEGSVQDTVEAYAHAAQSDAGHGKPWLLAELGISWRNNDSKFDPAGVGTNVHNGLWAGMMLGGLGGGCTWWWENYVELKKLWPVYSGIAKFAAAVDWPRRKFAPLAVARPRLPDSGHVAYSDLTLPATGGWGKAQSKTLSLSEEGELSGVLPGFLYGPDKHDMQAPTAVTLTLPAKSQVTVVVAKVSEASKLRITVDDQVGEEFEFRAKPGSPHQISTTQDATHQNWVADFDAPCTVELPGGKHTITLDNVAGDWMQIKSITVDGFKSSLIPDVRAIALQDSELGETLVWLQDIHSNWYGDLHKTSPHTYSGLTLILPAARPGGYQVDWWDTRQGVIRRSDRVSATDRTLRLEVPPFSRDVAIRVSPLPDPAP
jgi:hypothetical protein